ncbi:class I SAM-dependent methyltransferase [Ramlibacter humi]|uniref:Class I SAM-dependent methyltransferase n=1 Tax=Ramlibacter humi TaxID=2530451 RepID=A0A4Z0C8C1_9BURK|nr:class I SAM-dependent methyltransferase [Ramlibacter humi]TFZ07863.1 class I SAM-dependent methyltransferase [Ramlibacter humi]
MESSVLAELNAEIGRGYDRIAYDPVLDASLDLERLLGLSVLFGGTPPRDPDVLDFGSGTGSLLERLATQTQGRLTGVDISAQACERAAARCRPFGSRVNVLCRDFLALDPDTLGQFDVACHIGVLYVLPPALRAEVLRLLGRCLKPGGALVISYYTGAFHAARAALHRSVREAVSPGEAGIPAARAHIEAMAQALPPAGPLRDMLLAVMRTTQELPDTVFFHEVLNGRFDTLETAQLDSALSPFGVGFAGWLDPLAQPPGSTPRERAVAADALDYAAARYRHAVFVRMDAGARPDVARPAWRSCCVAAAPSAEGRRYQLRGQDVHLTVHQPRAAAVLDALAQGPLPWESIVAAWGHGAPESALRAGLESLWRGGAIAPLWPRQG